MRRVTISTFLQGFVMNQQCVVGIFSDLNATRSALEALEKENFTEKQVSLVTSSVENQVKNEEMLEYGDKGAMKAAKGAGMGGLVGMLLGAPMLMVPGVGPLVVAGPLAMGLTGGIVGGFLGAMTGWGVEPDNVEKYQQMVTEGAVLIVVEGPPDEVARAHELLSAHSPDEVRLHAKSGTDSPEVDDRTE
jgi:uncharacterized membrane protein